MALLEVRNIFKAYADNSILEGASLQVNPGEKIGLVGANGSGKTTLLKLIMGLEEPDQGEVFISKGLSLGYLSQKPGFMPRASLQDVLTEALSEIYSIKEELSRLEKEMSFCGADKKETVLASLMERYAQLSQIFEEKGGYQLENRLRMIARGLGFQESDLQRRVENFSGGEKTRTQLAALLLREPDLLLLDEPTNSLDSESVEWLENYLGSWRGGLLVVSHDRFFLDRIAGKIVVLENKKLRSYRGNFSSFMAQREVERVTLEKAYKKQEATIKKDLEFIRNASGDERAKRQARSREKRLAKLDLLQKPDAAKSWKTRFGYAGRGNRSVVVLEKVAKSFGPLTVFTDVTFKINWGDRVAIVGPNGAGKTTLLRIITGGETFDSGIVEIGQGIRIAYFDQEHKSLKSELTVLENIIEASGMTEAEARRYLGSYLFQGDMVFKKVHSLSGGEKSRLALAKMALGESNFLVMDEPTNHLDIWGIEELETSLSAYPGTLLIVSHDRFFISRTATKILEVKDKRVTLYNGTYLEYKELKEKESKNSSFNLSETPAKQQRREKREREKALREEILALRRKKRKLHSLISGIEEKIALGEKKISCLEEQLARPGMYDDFNKVRPLLDELTKTRDEVGELYEEWEKLSLSLDELPQEE
ncbi:MAG: ABC-F family ATP-binding cassette domain-containing protein [Firmicutes bacterium]|nr:ABC-F family ATP-binding cassette domain-containing protein [Bacillota bacterium]